MKQVKRWLRNYFGFSRRETNGFLVLLLLMGLCLVVPALFSLFTPAYDPTKDQQLLDSLVAQIEKAEKVPAQKPVPAPLAKGRLPTQPFDPNTLSAEAWTELGVPMHLATRIKNYQAKGGMFKTKEDVARIYGFPEELYTQLYPLIDLPTREEFLANRTKPRYPVYEPSEQRPTTSTASRPTNRRVPLQIFDINQADTTQLMRIRGIGSKRAQWIVKHRKKLGGFTTSQQYAEVFGLDSAVVDSLQKYAYVAPDFTPAKLYINRVTVEELIQHPYLTYKAARAIVAYREQHGRYTRPDDLRKVKLVSEEMLRKLIPYLEF